MPLPPYIKATLDQPERYQTVYAKNEGSAAAPTAGLHFTNALLSGSKQRGVQVASPDASRGTWDLSAGHFGHHRGSRDALGVL